MYTRSSARRSHSTHPLLRLLFKMMGKFKDRLRRHKDEDLTSLTVQGSGPASLPSDLLDSIESRFAYRPYEAKSSREASYITSSLPEWSKDDLSAGILTKQSEYITRWDKERAPSSSQGLQDQFTDDLRMRYTASIQSLQARRKELPFLSIAEVAFAKYLQSIQNVRMMRVWPHKASAREVQDLLQNLFRPSVTPQLLPDVLEARARGVHVFRHLARFAFSDDKLPIALEQLRALLEAQLQGTAAKPLTTFEQVLCLAVASQPWDQLSEEERLQAIQRQVEGLKFASGALGISHPFWVDGVHILRCFAALRDIEAK